MHTSFNFNTFTADHELEMKLHGVSQKMMVFFKAIMKAFPQATCTIKPVAEVMQWDIEYLDGKRKVCATIFLPFDVIEDAGAFRYGVFLESAKMAVIKAAIDGKKIDIIKFQGFETFSVEQCQQYLNGEHACPEYLLYMFKLTIASQILAMDTADKQRNDINKVSDEFYPNRHTGRSVYNIMRDKDTISHDEIIVKMRKIGKSMKDYIK